MGNAGWIAALIFCACSAIRLARFNVQSVARRRRHQCQSLFHRPAHAGRRLHDAAADADQLSVGDRFVREPGFTSVVIVVTSVLMVSRLPTPSIKYMHLPKKLWAFAWLAFGAFVILLINWPWQTLTAGFRPLRHG